MKKVKKSNWGGGKVTKVAGMNLTPMNEGESILVNGKPVTVKPKAKPKEKTLKQLHDECKKRNIGFMTTWSKTALIKRLEDEDKKDEEIQGLKDLIKRKENSYNILATKPLLEAKKQLKKNKIELEGYENRIKKLMDEKFELMQKNKPIRQEIEQLEVLIKSLI